MIAEFGENDHFDGNLRADVTVLFSRRKLFGLGATGLILAGCDSLPFMGGGEANATGTAADGTSCIKLPQETNGPFPSDDTNACAGATVNVLDQSGVVRPDMRASFGAYSDVAEGVPLALEIRLVNVKNACAPLAGHLIYLWQCDAEGQYSLYERTESNRLRGAAITDDAGIARIITIVPGCYSGRWPHIHLEVFVSVDQAAAGTESLLTSQFAFTKVDCDSVYAAHPAYAASAANLAALALDSDMVFRDNTAEQVKAQTLVLDGGVAQGYSGKGTIGIMV